MGSRLRPYPLRGPMTMLEVVALLVCVAIVAATVGASVTVAILFKHKSADDAHLETLLAPIRTDVVELHDNIESWGRRIDKRARDARRSSSSDDLELPATIPAALRDRHQRDVQASLAVHATPSEADHPGDISPPRPTVRPSEVLWRVVGPIGPSRWCRNTRARF